MAGGDETLRRTENRDLPPFLAQFCRSFPSRRRWLRGAAARHSPKPAAYGRVDAPDEKRRGQGHRRGTLLRFENTDRKSTRLNSSHGYISYAVFCLKKKTHYHCSCYRSQSGTVSAV